MQCKMTGMRSDCLGGRASGQCRAFEEMNGNGCARQESCSLEWSASQRHLPLPLVAAEARDWSTNETSIVHLI